MRFQFRLRLKSAQFRFKIELLENDGTLESDSPDRENDPFIRFEAIPKPAMTIETQREPDLELLRRTAAGDKEAFRELYESTHEKVFYYLVRLIGRDRAEDMLTETYLQVWKSSGNFQGRSKVTTWIISIARNLSLKEIKKNSRYQPYEDLDLVNNNSTWATDEEMEARSRKKVVKQALSQLGPKHQEVLDLFFFHQRTYQEISEIMDISINTVKSRIFYAKEQLQGILGEMGIERHEI